MTPNYILRSAVPGEPSILWIGKSGRKYRTLVAAKIDKPENAFENSVENLVVNFVQTTDEFNNDNSVIIVLLSVVAVIVLFKFL